MVVHNGFDIYIVTPNGRLPEHAFPDLSTATPYTKTIYLEVPSDSTPFIVKVKPISRRKLTGLGFGFLLSLDGFTSATAHFVLKYFRYAAVKPAFKGFSLAEPNGKESSTKPMFFEPAHLELASDEAGAESAKNGNLGVVEVIFKKLGHIERCNGRVMKNEGVRPTGCVTKEMARESSGLSHLTRIGGASLDQPAVPFSSATAREGDPLYAVRFVYRSRAALKSLGVGVGREKSSEGLVIGWVRRLFGKREEEMSFAEK